uniref:GLOBIN domain-containing protein n=1 Tax=Ascaris lumbricoides TaxID=6252 RepID=A0A0M3HUH3_ASCLU
MHNEYTNFRHLALQDENLCNISEIKCTCYCLGKQHAAYTAESFKVVYWDEFTLAMMEELENSSRLESEDLRAWQTFLHLIVENMLNGYDHAKNTQIEK